MATTFNRYDGPPLNLAKVMAYIDVLRKKNGAGPSEDELVKEIHLDNYAGLSRKWVMQKVRRIVEYGINKGYIESRMENGVMRYYTRTT